MNLTFSKSKNKSCDFQNWNFGIRKRYEKQYLVMHAE